MKNRFHFSLLSVALVLILAGNAWADITSKPVMITGIRNRPINIYLDLDATAGEAVAGINGQLTYDPAIFSNPTIGRNWGSGNFTALGNEVAPGQFNFVIYADPTSTMNIDLPIADFRLEISAAAQYQDSHTLTFTTSAAATPEGISLSKLGQVQFQNFVVNIAGNAAQDWAIYQ